MAAVPQAAELLPSARQPAQLAVLVHRVHNPIDARVLPTADTLWPNPQLWATIYPASTLFEQLRMLLPSKRSFYPVCNRTANRQHLQGRYAGLRLCTLRMAVCAMSTRIISKYL